MPCSFRFFEETMRRNMPDTNNHLLESMHLRRFNEKQYKQVCHTLPGTARQAGWEKGWVGHTAEEKCIERYLIRNIK